MDDAIIFGGEIIGNDLIIDFNKNSILPCSLVLFILTFFLILVYKCFVLMMQFYQSVNCLKIL